MTVPTDRDRASVVALVECALVEPTHKAVGVVFVAHQIGRSTRTQYVASDDITDELAAIEGMDTLKEMPAAIRRQRETDPARTNADDTVE